VTAASLLEKLDRVYDGASAAAQFSAAGRAVETQAKISGVMTDRVEVGAPGAFGNGYSVEELIDQFGNGDPAIALASFEDAVLDIRADLEARAAAHAKVIASPPSPRPKSEAAPALELLRPERRRGRAD
jgi:hypothetical protein